MSATQQQIGATLVLNASMMQTVSQIGSLSSEFSLFGNNIQNTSHIIPMLGGFFSDLAGTITQTGKVMTLVIGGIKQNSQAFADVQNIFNNVLSATREEIFQTIGMFPKVSKEYVQVGENVENIAGMIVGGTTDWRQSIDATNKGIVDNIATQNMFAESQKNGNNVVSKSITIGNSWSDNIWKGIDAIKELVFGNKSLLKGYKDSTKSMLLYRAIMEPLNSIINGMMTPMTEVNSILGDIGEVISIMFMPAFQLVDGVLVGMIPDITNIATKLQPIGTMMILILNPLSQLLFILPPIIGFISDICNWFTTLGVTSTNTGTELDSLNNGLLDMGENSVLANLSVSNLTSKLAEGFGNIGDSAKDFFGLVNTAWDKLATVVWTTWNDLGTKITGGGYDKYGWW